MIYATFTELTISGAWVDYGVSEDCVFLVGWRFSNEDFDEPVPKLINVEDCYGVLSGTRYLDKLIMSPDLMAHLQDMISEKYEV